MRRPPQPPLPTFFEPAPALEGGPVAPPDAAAAPHLDTDEGPRESPDCPDAAARAVAGFALSADPDAADPVDDDNPFGLTLREEAFVTAVTGVAIGNATKAYALAGYSTIGLGATVRTNAANLLKKPRIRRALVARRRELRASLDGAMEREEAIRRLSVIARGDPREIWAHEPLIVGMPAHVAACIKGVVRTEQGLRLEVYDRVHALEVVGKWLGLVHEQVNVVHASLEEVLAASRRPETLDVEAVAS